MAQRYNTGNQRPSNSMKDLNDNALANDDYMNSEADTFIDRLGDERDTLRGSTKKMLAAGAAVVEETRQNLIPLSKQYMTLAAAQADIANIPVNATTYVRSQDGSALAVEYLNNSGTLQATGRKMPSRSSVLIGVVDSWVNSTIYPFDTLISKNENSLLVHIGEVSSITYREAYSDLADPVAAGDIITVRVRAVDHLMGAIRRSRCVT